MTAMCAACGIVREVSLHTANGWVCHSCERSASALVLVYVIRGQKFYKLLKGVDVNAATPSQEKENENEH
jgi:hypothetical protein